MNSYKGELPEKIRKNAVMAVECLATASPEFFNDKTKEEQQAFFNDSLKFIQDRFGADNVISAVVHNDESTPHLQALVIPKVSGKLNARSLIGGSKHELSKLQTDYHKRVEHHGLERGQEKSKAKHTTIKDFYTNIEQTRSEVTQELKTATREKEMARSAVEYNKGQVKKLQDKVSHLERENKTLMDKLKEFVGDIKNKLTGAKHARIRERGRTLRGREEDYSIGKRRTIHSQRDTRTRQEIRNEREPIRHRGREQTSQDQRGPVQGLDKKREI